MPIRENTTYGSYFGSRYARTYEFVDSKNSPRVGGRLVLQNNPLTFDRRVLLNASFVGVKLPGYMPGPVGAHHYLNRNKVSLDNKAYAKLRGKLYQGSGSLGVTLAGYSQSANMVRTRYASLNREADAVLASSAKLTPKKLAGLHLETIFGWMPLVQDVRAACTTIVQHAPVDVWVAGAHTIRDNISRSVDGYYFLTQEDAAISARSRYSARVTVSNPNAWLLERAGLLNIGAVAWDIVPYSFLVNMVVNTGALVNSITDFTGLSFRDFSVTHSATYHGSRTSVGRRGYDGSADLIERSSYKTRMLTAGPPTPRLEFRIPDMSWDTVAMLGSLFTAKFSAISRLIRPHIRSI